MEALWKQEGPKSFVPLRNQRWSIDTLAWREPGAAALLVCGTLLPLIASAALQRCFFEPAIHACRSIFGPSFSETG